MSNEYPLEWYSDNSYLPNIPYDADKCAQELWHGKSIYQCARKPGYGDRKLFCKEHAKRHPAPAP